MVTLHWIPGSNFKLEQEMAFQQQIVNGFSLLNTRSFYTEMVWPGFISRMFVRNSKMAKKERIKKKLQNQQNNC